MSLRLGPLRTIGKRPGAGRDRPAFRPDDAIDELFSGANANPRRIGCPENQVLRAAARRALQMEHEVYTHLANCSECYREFRAIQQSNARGSWIRAMFWTAAALVIAAIWAASFDRGLIVGAWNRVPQAIVLDYRTEGVNRSDGGNAIHEAVVLPRKNVIVTILMPTGSEPGTYEIRVIDERGHVWLSRAAVGKMQNFVMSLRATLDLQSLKHGSYFLETRGAGEDWDAHPISVQ